MKRMTTEQMRRIRGGETTQTTGIMTAADAMLAGGPDDGAVEKFLSVVAGEVLTRVPDSVGGPVDSGPNPV